MDNKQRLRRLLEQLNLDQEVNEAFKDGEILSVLHKVKEKDIVVSLFLQEEIDLTYIDAFKQRITRVVDVNTVTLNISYDSDLVVVNLPLLEEQFNKFLDYISKRVDPFLRVFKNRKIGYINEEISITATSNIELQTFNKVIPYFENYLKTNLIRCKKVVIELDTSVDSVALAREEIKKSIAENTLVQQYDQ